MAETEDPSSIDDPALEITQGFSGTARALFSAGSVADTLQRVVDLAVKTIEGCDYAGIFLLEGDAVTTPVHTDPVVIEIDASSTAPARAPASTPSPTGARCTPTTWPATTAGPGSGRRRQPPVSAPSSRSPCPATAPTGP